MKLLKIVMMKWRKFWRHKMYENQIDKLQQQFNNLDTQISVAKQNPNYDPLVIQNMESQRHLMYYEIQRLKRKQWEEDNERVEFDDDR